MESHVSQNDHLDQFEQMEKHFHTGLTPQSQEKENINNFNQHEVDFGDFENNEYGTILTVDAKESFNQTPLSVKPESKFLNKPTT